VNLVQSREVSVLIVSAGEPAAAEGGGGREETARSCEEDGRVREMEESSQGQLRHLEESDGRERRRTCSPSRRLVINVYVIQLSRVV